MAYRSDSSGRDINNRWNLTVLQGELKYDAGVSVPYGGEIEKLEDELQEYDVEVSQFDADYQSRVKILYSEEDQEEILDLISRVTG